ncbi:MAG: hypothetical protein M1450_04955 [Patescibacteria group bacterium]|nr:hypothetical protein [Patescibacteria group bacterium]
MREIDTTYESWSKRRIIIGIFIIVALAVLGFFVKDSVIKDKEPISLFKNPKTTVAGVSTKGEDTANSTQNTEKPVAENLNIQSTKLKKDLQERLDSIKKEFSELDAKDIASSSPQFKRVMDDIQSLKDLPRNQAKEACYTICKGL